MRLSPVGIANSEERNRHPKTQVPNTGTWGTLQLSTSTGIIEVISSHRHHVNKIKILQPGPPAVRRDQQGDRWTSDGICEPFYREVCCRRQRNQTGSASLRTGLSPESSKAMTTDF